MGLVQSDEKRTVTFENDNDPGLNILVTEDVRKRIFEKFGEGKSGKSSEKPANPRPLSIDGSENLIQEHDNQNGESWRENVQSIENVLHKSNTIMENEFQTTYAQVQNTFADAPLSNRVSPCGNFKEELLQCYNSNQGHTLKCFAEVTAFSECVSGNRIKRLDKTQDVFDYGNDIKF